MKEELIRVLTNKLDDINVNIESLTKLNEKIDDETRALSYTNGILNLFKDDGKYNILNFTKLSKDNFDKVLSIVDGLDEMFNSSSCNYDGLVYLINGINNGISLSLTLEQENAINYLIQKVEEKSSNHEASIDGLLLAKSGFEVSDVNLLNDEHNRYEKIINEINESNYVDEVDKIKEAIDFNKVDSDKTIDMLIYLLKHNSDVYKSGKFTKDEANDQIDYTTEKESEVKEDEITFTNQEEFHLPEFNTIDTEKENYHIPPITISEDSNELNINELPELNNIDVDDKEINKEEIDKEFKDVLSQSNEYEEYNVPEDETITISPIVNEDSTSTREIQRLFSKHSIKLKDEELSELTSGNIDSYSAIIELLDSKDLLKLFVKNKELFKNILLNSNAEVINEVLEIVKNDLSVDEDDYEMTIKIVMDTLPTIFVKEDGNYDNFVLNVKFFKDLGINLINLFDFSKEVFIVSNDRLVNNYNVVKNYNINLDYKNVKYMLLLDNIGERLDYFVESVYPDRTKNNEKFDGITYITNYPNKLNCVTIETIKRLRYSSETSKKVFGNKPNSLAGEITNLKVNVLEIPNDYLSNLFDNNFDVITTDEVREYNKLCQSSSNVGNFTNELSSLEEFHNGLRYTVNNINISYNKVMHNYNTLRSYGIDKKKALLFAVCHNLVITKDEYNMIKKLLEERVGE